MNNPEEETVFLTLGDGDFTFSLDLANFLSQQQSRHNVRLVATGIDSLEALTAKYRDTPFILGQLERTSTQDDSVTALSVTVKHNVNAISVATHSDHAAKLQGHHVIFNHPHLGTEDAVLHGQFLCHLFHSVSSSWLLQGGCFHLTLAQGQYDRWKCADAAREQGFELLHRQVFRAPPVSCPYYHLRRHQTGKSFKSRVLGPSEICTFRLKTESSVSELPSRLPWYTDAKDGNFPETNGSTPEEDLNKFPCPHCDRVFNEKRSVKNHIHSKHGTKRKREQDMMYICDICKDAKGNPRVFSSAEALAEHTEAKHRALHSEIRPDWCNKGAVFSEATTSSLVPCDICKASIPPGEQGKQVHMQAFVPGKDGEQEAYQCSFCNKQFSQDRARLQHENRCPERTGSVHTDGNTRVSVDDS